MLSFELSAIDLILAIAVIILLILQLSSSQGSIFDNIFSRKWRKKTNNNKEQMFEPKNKYTECPRGFGKIKRISADKSVSDRCLGCYQIMDCYSEPDNLEDAHEKSVENF